MIVAGVILIILSLVAPDFALGAPPGVLHLIAIGGVVGWILLIVGIIFLLFGFAGRPVGGRRFWY